MSRLEHVRRLYALLAQLDSLAGGKRSLSDLPPSKAFPKRGVYFFFEPSERRSESGEGSRLVRVGTHGLGVGAKSTLMQRLKQHRGQVSGGGNHRGSIFRLLIGEALIARGVCPPCPSWAVKRNVSSALGALKMTRAELLAVEVLIEQAVSTYLGRMQFLCLPIDDEPGPESLRGFVERNSIALISNLGKTPIDSPSPEWLGHASARERVRHSGLWNQRHVNEDYDRSFLAVFEHAVAVAQSNSTLHPHK